jgi:AraC family transcriptional regulator
MQVELPVIKLAQPRFEQTDPQLFAGLREPMGKNSDQEIPLLWQRFMPLVNTISLRSDKNFYGLCVQAENHKQDFYYMASCALNDFNNLPVELSPIIVPSQNYAVFSHDQHVSRIRETISLIFDEWLPASNFKLAQKPTHSIHFFEKYTEAFSPDTGLGGMEIWLPITGL